MYLVRRLLVNCSNVFKNMLIFTFKFFRNLRWRLLVSYGERAVRLILCIHFAGLGDLKFHLVGYLDALSSVIAQATYLTYVQKTGLEKGVSALSVLHLNSINCIPLMFSYSLMNGSLVKALHFPFDEPSAVVCIALSPLAFVCVLGSLFIFSVFSY